MNVEQKSEDVGILFRASRFLRKPLHEKSRSFLARWVRFFPRIPVPVRLSFGVWFVARGDDLGKTLTSDEYEKAERAFLERFLRPGTTVLDIGAHQGLYTLLAAKLVGPNGSVFAFEPSPRERRALRLNLVLNRCRNVLIESVAVGVANTTATLHVVQDIHTGCNSLKPPNVRSATRPIQVPVIRLDEWVQKRNVPRVDFIKLDVEGAELTVLQGAEGLLLREPRPMILSEIQEVRTRPWGYSATEIVRYLSERDYRWFSFRADGAIEELDVSLGEFDGNFLACPEESIPELATCLH